MDSSQRYRRGASAPMNIPKEGDWKGLTAVLQTQQQQINTLTDELDRVRRLSGVEPLRKK